MTATKTRKTRKTETHEQILDRWMADSVRSSYADLEASGWEAGQGRYITVGDANYEQFKVAGGFGIVEWTETGDVCVI